MAKKPTKSSFRFRPVLWINYGFIILLLLTNLVLVVAPDVFWPISLMGLIFPATVLVNILFIVIWLLLLKRFFLYSLLALILSYVLVLDHIQPGFSKAGDVQESNDAIEILSFNARNLSNNNMNIGDKLIRTQIMEFVASHKADIVCFQEFQSYPTRGVNSVEDYKFGLGLKHVYKAPYLLKNSHEFLDLLVLFSKYPILNSNDFYMDGKSYGFYVDLKIKEETVRVFNLHLESNHFNRNDYQIFTDTETTFDPKKRNHLIVLFQKLKKYSVKRSFQARRVKQEIAKSPYPVIIIGDFNDTPASFSYQHIAGNLHDAFKQKGKGYSNTYNGDLPPMRIDYALFSDHFNIDNYQVLDVDLSDHFPIKVRFSQKKDTTLTN